ncbi:MAG: toll/interleukin-1 receptor domain-containing protein, partial [bacterium]|nr:toll/interleukin-1 receptor domain-containing protein [bacterium]
MSGEDPRERRTRPVEVFISYSHKDKELCDQLVGHLQALVTDGEIRIWYDRAITGGRQWAGEIDRHLESADLVLLLLSADFIKSEYCYKFEMGRALERQDAGEARVVPVVLRPVDLPDTLEQRQCLPAEGKAITTWANRDQAYVDAVKGIRRVLEEIGPKSPPVASLSEPVDTRLPDVRIVQ